MYNHIEYVVALGAALALGTGSNCFAAGDQGVVKVDLPAETATLQPGPGKDTAAKYCMICHSVDYIYMQPPMSQDKWKGVVTKMKKVFGAPIADGDIDTIAAYLASQNGPAR